MSEHTKGKWVVHSGSIYQDDGLEYARKRLLMADRDNSDTTPTERDANIKRAALCVNVLDGISNEDIKKFQILLDKNPDLLKKWLAVHLLFME